MDEVKGGRRNDQAVPGASGEEIFHVVTTSKDVSFDVDYMGESTKGDMKLDRALYDSLG